MAELFELGMYFNKENGKTVELIEVNETSKRVQVIKEDGTPGAYLISSFKKHWKKIEKAEEATVPESEEIADEKQLETADKVESKEEVKPVSAETEKKAEKKKSKKESIPTVDTTLYKEKLDILAEKYGLEVKKYDKLPNMVVLKCNGKGRMEVRFSRKGSVFNIKEGVLIDVPYRTVNNYYLPVTIDVEYTSYEKELEHTIKAVVNFAKNDIKKEEQNEEV